MSSVARIMTMTDTGTRYRVAPMVRLFAVSMVVGVVLGIATSFVFLLIIGVPLLGILLGGAGLRGNPEIRRIPPQVPACSWETWGASTSSAH